jgi:prepilin-type N-terminal cleavage/methylation domain-containing protein
MSMQPPPLLQCRSRRPGVTLVELLVSISIVAMLACLTFFLFKASEAATDKVANNAGKVTALVAKKNLKAQRAVPAPAVRAASNPVPNQFLVRFNHGVHPKVAAAQLATTLSAKILHVYGNALNGCAVQIQPGRLAALQADPNVRSVEQDQYIHHCQAIVPTGVSRIRYANAPKTPPIKVAMPSLLNLSSPKSSGGIRNLPGSGGNSVQAVAVIDTGIDSTHPDLNVVFSMGFGLPDGEDQDGHGTHVSGTIGARGLGGMVVGVFPNVPLWSLRVLDANGSGTFAQLISALDYLHANASQVSVANMSLGGGFSQSVNDAVDNCVLAGVTCCVAAGNSSQPASQLSPASAPLAICVAALCDTDGRPGGRGAPGSFGDPDDTFTSFSCFGSAVTVIAPGEDILSTWLVSGGSFNTISGTSMATPHVSGLSALVLSANQKSGHGSLRNLPGQGSQAGFVRTPADVRNFLIGESVERIPGLSANSDSLTYPLITGRP